MKLKGPNQSFEGLIKKGNDNVAPNGNKSTDLKSVNHAGKIPDTNPGAKEQSRKHFGSDPGEKGALTGFEQNGMGNVEIGGKISLNSGTRAFTYSKSGHAVDNGSSSEGQ